MSNIVHIGKGTTPQEIDAIIALRDAGHDVYVPGDSTGEQLVRRIIYSDEVHIWDASMVFELGIVYFFSVHALHYRLSWLVKVFCDPGRGNTLLPLFTQSAAEPGLDVGEKPILLDLVEPEPEFVPPCHSGIGPCNECTKRELCEQERAEHKAEPKLPCGAGRTVCANPEFRMHAGCGKCAANEGVKNDGC